MATLKEHKLGSIRTMVSDSRVCSPSLPPYPCNADDVLLADLEAQPLKLTTGSIWASLGLDYPHHSFSHIGVYYGQPSALLSLSNSSQLFAHTEGANGHLPNLDFLNAASRILRLTGITPLLHSYDSDSTPALPSALSSLPFANHPEVQQYSHAARNLFRQLALGADGRVNGPESTYGRYRIDAITLFGVVAEGPHGFHALGRCASSLFLISALDGSPFLLYRATESIFRSLNNLLERFHQSFFLYIMTSVDSFIAVGNYLAAPIITGAGLTITGLMVWSEAGKAGKGSRPTTQAMTAVGVAAVAGLTELFGLLSVDPAKEAPVRTLPFFPLSSR
jgi:hypothetical protein